MERENHEIKQTVAEPRGAKTAPQENLTIPKHRFDCVNLCLKETKEALREKAHEAASAAVRIAELEKALLNAKVETALAVYRARNLTAVMALIDFSNLKLEHDGSVPGLKEQILHIKKSQNYLFENETDMIYALVPVNSGDPLNKSIANYIKRTERTK